MKLLPTSLFTLILLFIADLSSAQIVKTYQESSADYINPERGMYRYFETRTSGAYSPLDEETLEDLREEDQQSLIYRIFYLDGFYTDPISTEVLNAIEQDFTVLRASGIKAMVRFAYTDELNYDENDEPITPFNDTPEPALLFQHIHQLRSILQNNSDVILTVHNGFYGIWGENYYSDDFGTAYPGPITAPQQELRDAVTDSLLAILPADRTVSVRYPSLKTEFLNLQIPEDSLTLAEAFQGSDKSRIAYHNDCFLADYNDYTFLDTLTEKPYWAAESRYVLMGGETCRDEETYTQCSNALAELSRFHWTYLNDDYHPDVLQRWQQEGCFAEIRRKLGYQFVLREATLPETVEQGSPFSLSLKMDNTGWAAPMLPRPIELVLRHTVSNAEIFLPLEAIDLRYCGGGQSCEYNLDLVLNDPVPAGEYDLLLFLPDGRSNLREDPRFSIHLDNVGLWESTTGMHNLQHTITLTEPTCPEDLTIDNGTIEEGTYRASNDLEVSVEVETEATVRFTAGNSIRFLPGFLAPAGSEVTAMIQDCLQEQALPRVVYSDQPEQTDLGIHSSLQLWPNPTSGRVNVRYQVQAPNQAESVTAALSDPFGRIIRLLELIPEQTSTLDFSALPKGMYLLSWQDRTGRHTQKLIRQ